MEDGLGFCLTTMLLNAHQKEQGLLEVRKQSVCNAFHCLCLQYSRIDKVPQKAENQKLWAEAQ